MSTQPDLFDQGDMSGMVHRAPLPTEVASAASLAPKRRAIQLAVLQALAEGGPQTAEQLELLPRFLDYGPSTIRKRVSELYAAREVVIVGRSQNSRGRPMMVWALPGQ